MNSVQKRLRNYVARRVRRSSLLKLHRRKEEKGLAHLTIEQFLQENHVSLSDESYDVSLPPASFYSRSFYGQTIRI